MKFLKKLLIVVGIIAGLVVIFSYVNKMRNATLIAAESEINEAYKEAAIRDLEDIVKSLCESSPGYTYEYTYAIENSKENEIEFEMFKDGYHAGYIQFHVDSYTSPTYIKMTTIGKDGKHTDIDLTESLN